MSVYYLAVEGILQVAIDGITYVSHEDPAWRGENHEMAMVDLAPFDLPGMLEQLWLREVNEEGAYEVCCIPFYAYGVALGDVIEKGESGSMDRVIEKSGRRVLRILFSESRPALDSRPMLRRTLDSAGLLNEWNGDRHVAIDVPDDSVMQPIYDSVRNEIEGTTAFWEWNDSKRYTSG
ncbi:DUF4265 domain-containing protein [Streptomyces sp. NPDC086777]|uniref:DUF4265 domain-containing protein n=1 Tax=Streptomyces sp. NPDC086777 TaxID=3154866 RepID=UPI00344BAECC